MAEKGKIPQLVSDLIAASRLGGGEGWFGSQKKLEGVNVSRRGMPGQTQVDPTFADSKEVRGILGALEKQKLLRDLEKLAKTEEAVSYGVPVATQDKLGQRNQGEVQIWDTGQVTPLRYVGEGGEALAYGGALEEANRAQPGDIPSYRDWRPDDGTMWMDQESAAASDIYKEYAQSPKNLLQLLMRVLGGRQGGFRERFDYREEGEVDRYPGRITNRGEGDINQEPIYQGGGRGNQYPIEGQAHYGKLAR